MKVNISKAQKEVREWKERLNKELESLSAQEQLRYIQKKTAKLVQKIKRKKQSSSPSDQKPSFLEVNSYFRTRF
jgi:chaperonin cofactor prefoldin